MPPPEHRLKGPFRGSGTSGGAVMPQPKHSGKGTGSSGGSGENAGCGGGIGGMGSRGANPLRSLSDLTGNHGFQRMVPSTTPNPAATSQPRFARATKHTRPWSSSDPWWTRRKHQAGSLNVETPMDHQTAVKGSSGETPRKHQTVTVYKAAQKHCIKEKTGGSSSGGMARKSCTKERALPSVQVLHLHPPGTQRAGTIYRRITRQKQSENNPSISSDTCTGLSLVSNAVAQHCKELDADKKIQLPEEMMKQVQEGDLVIQQLNELGLGEDINDEELQCYYEQLPCEHTCVDTSLELGDEQIKKLRVNHVLYRIKYYKLTQERRKNELASILEHDCYRYHLEEKLKCFVEDETKLKKDHILDHLDKEGLLAYIEKDDTFDWSFQYHTVAALDDYQRLVPRNRGGSEYVHWNDYREYFHKYEIEREYLLFWKELLKKLKWMEDYLNIKRTTLKWSRISKRGESQAIKIATGFSKITVGLAHAAYYECIGYMSTEFHWYRELDGVYFEIWKRITKLEMSFREALDEVHKSGMFLLRQHQMEHALEVSYFKMEKEFHYCTEGITEEDTEEKARELIADAITKMLRRPKCYAQYIMKKMEVATAIGVIPQGPP